MPRRRARLAHVARGCQGPANMAACPTETKDDGGLGSIAEQEVDHKVDVLLGGGRARFAQLITGGPHVGKTVVSRRRRRATSTSRTPTAWAACNEQAVLGLFNASNMRSSGPARPPSLGKGNAPVACTEDQRPANEPSLAEMTAKALEPAGEQQGLLPPGRGRLDRQAGPRRQCVRPDR